MKFSPLIAVGYLCLTNVSAGSPSTMSTCQAQQETLRTLGCGKYFMDKIHSLGLSFNRFFNNPYFIFRDCDGSEQRVFIACGCGATGYELTKYDNIFLEDEGNHPELDELIDRLEQGLRTSSLFTTENEKGELVYAVICS